MKWNMTGKFEFQISILWRWTKKNKNKKNPLTSERRERIPVGGGGWGSWQGAALVGQRRRVRQVDRHSAREEDNRYGGRRGTWEDAGQSTAWMCLIEESGRGTDQLRRRQETPSTPFSHRATFGWGGSQRLHLLKKYICIVFLDGHHRTATYSFYTTTDAFAGTKWRTEACMPVLTSFHMTGR